METMNTAPVTATTELNTYKPYHNQLVVDAPDSKRVVKCLYKLNKKTGITAGVNSYIVIPESHLAESVVIEQVTKLAPYVSAFLQEQEDLIIKEHHKSGGKGFADNFLSLQKILDALDAKGQGDRLNKEKIETWFQSNVLESLQLAFANKMGLSDTPTESEMDRLAVIVDTYKGKFSSLASGKTLYNLDEVEALQKVLTEVVPVSTYIGAKFMIRLESMKTAPANNIMEML